MTKLSKQNVLSLFKIIDSLAGLSFVIGLILGALYFVEIKAPEELILSLIFGGLIINLILLIKLKSESILVETIQSIWLIF